MIRQVGIAFVLVQLFGELGPWAGLRMKSALGPALWVMGMVVITNPRVPIACPELRQSLSLWRHGRLLLPRVHRSVAT
jgi:hypothetical protein